MDREKIIKEVYGSLGGRPQESGNVAPSKVEELIVEAYAQGRDAGTRSGEFFQVLYVAAIASGLNPEKARLRAESAQALLAERAKGARKDD